MTFDIRQLDKLDSDSEESEQALEAYQETLLELFAKSPEGEAHRQLDPEMGFWADQLMYYGYSYIGVTLPKMKAPDVEEIVTELFPRKISLSSPDDADEAIPELIAFWEYLQREYQLSQAKSILKYLRTITTNDFKAMMMDSSKFGMAKSFFMMGQSAGFDMTDENDTQEFIARYNAGIMAQEQQKPSLLSGLSNLLGGREASAAKKKRRKMAESSRRKNRKKRRKSS